MLEYIQAILANPVAGGIIGGSFLVSVVWAVVRGAPSKIADTFLHHFTTTLFIDGTRSHNLFKHVEAFVFEHVPESRRIRLRQIDRDNTVPLFGIWYFQYKNRWIRAHIQRIIRDGVPPEYVLELRTYGRCPQYLQGFIRESVPEVEPLPYFFTSLSATWYSRVQTENRTFDDLILNKAQQDRLLDEVTSFKEGAELYRKRGLLHQKGILLYGKPGTGKTTLALTLANLVGPYVYKFSLASLSDNEFRRLWMDKTHGSPVIIDDIDILENTRDRSSDSKSAESKRVSLDTLFSVLDGTFGYTPGTLIFLTTNHIEKLDPALIRNGRIDLQEEILGFDYPEVYEMCLRFLEDEKRAKDFARTVSLPAYPADLQVLLIRELNSRKKTPKLISKAS